MKLTTNNMFPREQLTKLINKLSNDNNKQRKEIHRLSQMNKAYADYFAKNNLDFSYHSYTIIVAKVYIVFSEIISISLINLV